MPRNSKGLIWSFELFYRASAQQCWRAIYTDKLIVILSVRPSVRPSVHPSVTLRYCIETAEYNRHTFFSIMVARSFQFSQLLNVFEKLRRGPPLRGRWIQRGVYKFRDFLRHGRIRPPPRCYRCFSPKKLSPREIYACGSGRHHRYLVSFLLQKPSPSLKFMVVAGAYSCRDIHERATPHLLEIYCCYLTCDRLAIANFLVFPEIIVSLCRPTYCRLILTSVFSIFLETQTAYKIRWTCLLFLWLSDDNWHYYF